MKQLEIRIRSPEEEINFNSLKNLDNYTEIIPQKIEKQKEEENNIDPNLEFSFGKDLKKHIETNRLKTDYFSKKEKDILSDNLSNYQLTDSLSNIMENDDGNKKMKLIKEKFIANFKSKDRNDSLNKALTLFEKFHNNFNKKPKLSNLSFSQKIEKPFQFLTSQSTNRLSIIDKKNENNEISNNNLNNNHTNILNATKSNENFFKYKIKKISKIIKEKDEEIYNSENIKNEKSYTQDLNNKKIFNLKNDKKKGIFIRKVIREEKYFIDEDGTEKLIGIKQSTYDTHNKKKKIKKINVNKIKKDKDNNNNNNNKTLFNKKKFAEYIKDKITNRKNNIPNENGNNNNTSKNIEINTEFINNKNINNDNCNNIKIVINKINKINSNPKINLNFIKKYRNGLKNKISDENKENIQNNIVYNINNKNLRHKNSEEINNICKTDMNLDNKKIHIIKVGKSINQSKIKSDILNNYKTSNELGKYQHKIKMSLPPMAKLKLIQCQKIKSSNKIPLTKIKKFNTNIQGPIKRDLTKRNYSFKEIRNLSKNSESNKYIFTKRLDRKDLEKNKNMINSNIDTFNENNLNENMNFKKYLIDTFNKKNKFNHNFYESKSFSLLNKSNIQSQNNNNIITDCHTPNSNRIIFYKYPFNKSNNDIKNKNEKNLSILNTNNNNYNINTSFNNIYNYNNTLC